MENALNILLVEDNPGDVLLLQEALRESKNLKHKLDVVDCMESFKLFIKQKKVDLILLDLGLPDTQGNNTFTKAYEIAPDIPIIVLTGFADEENSFTLMKLGAQDYLYKNEISYSILIRAIRYAYERNRQRLALNEIRAENKRLKEMKSLENLIDSAKPNVTSKIYGIVEIHKAAPEIFKELVNNFLEILNMALEKRIYKTELNISEKLREIAEQVGAFKGEPRDIIKIYSESLKILKKNTNQQKLNIYYEEGHFIILELMGYLAKYYKNH